MRILRAEVTAFGSLRDLSVEFAPGMNVVSGPNEAGKSTLFSALRHVLLTPSRLTRTQFTRLLGRHLPRPDGTVLEASVTLAADEELTVRRRWGDEPRSELVTADGVRITGDEVDRRIAAALPVRPGTWASIFLIDQAQLDATLEHLKASDESRDEVASLLRRTREETGGVAVEAFRRALAGRLKSVFDHWDRERDRPEGGRGIENPWRREIGALLNAHYALERARTTHAETVRAERELEEATAELEARSAALRTAADFVEAYREAYESLRQLDSLDRTIADAQRSLAGIRIAVRRWPVVVEELARREHEIQAATNDVAASEERLAGAAERRRRSERRALYDRAIRVHAEVSTARERAGAIPPVDEAALGELRSAEGESAQLLARLSAGSLRARVRGASAQRVAAETDGGEERSFDLEPGSPVDLQAHRRIAFRVGDVDVEVEAGDESFAELRARHEAAVARFESAAAALGVRGVEEAVARRGEHAAARRELAAAERRYAELLGEESMDALRDEFDERTEPESQVDESAIARALAEARGRLGEARAAKRALEQEAKSFAERYADQEALEDALAETRGRLSALEAERAKVARVPDGFESTPGFLAVYRDYEQSLDAHRAAHHEARIRQTELLARLPERTSEELAALVADAERVFARARRRGEALARLERAVADTVAEERADPYAPYAERVASYLSAVSGDRYVAERTASPLLPDRYRRGGGPVLDYAMLSQGTRDMVALAVRLALAETAAPGVEAPLLLDDPLVDMDPERRATAAAAIARYGATRQLLLFTCHPDHAALFPDAHRVDLSPG